MDVNQDDALFLRAMKIEPCELPPQKRAARRAVSGGKRQREARTARCLRDFWMFVLGAALAWWGAWMVFAGGFRG